MSLSIKPIVNANSLIALYIQCCIDLGIYEPLKLHFKNEQIKLSAILLMDYGLVISTSFTDPDQTDFFGQKLVNCVLNTFTIEENYVSLLIISKPPKWDTV